MAVAAVAIGSSAAGAYVAGTTFALTAGTFAYVATATAVSFAVSYAANELLGLTPDRPDMSSLDSKAQGLLQNLASPVSPIPVVYGFRKVGGARVFAETTGEDNKYLHLVLVASEGEINSFEQIYFNDDTELASSDKVTYEYFTGSDDQAASSSLVSEVSAWTENHRLRGVAYSYVRLEYDQDEFASGLPTITFDVKGVKVYDPRTTTTAWSDNPALCIRDYLTNERYGRGIPESMIDDATFIAAANYCDESVTKGGESATRYTCNGVVDTSRTSLEIIKELLTSCRGFLVFSGGKYKLILDKIETPSFTFNEDNIHGAWSINLGSKQTTYNRIRAEWFNPERSWQGDIAVVDSTTLRTADNGLLLEREIQLPFTSDYATAMQIATLNLNQSRQQITCSFNATIEGLRCEVGDVVYVTHSTPAWTAKPFRVMSVTINNADEVAVSLLEYHDDVYDFGTIDAASATPDTNLPSTTNTVIPSITVSDELRTRNQEAISVLIVDLITASPFTQSFEVEAKKSTDTAWVSLGRAASNRYELLNVEDGVIYNVRARSVNMFNARSAYDTADHQVVGKTAPPQDVTGFTGNVINGALVLTWNPVTDLDLSHYRLRYASATSGVTYQNAINLVSKIPRPSASAIVPARTGTYYIKAVDKLGLASETASTLVIDTNVAGVENLNYIATLDEHPSFAGTKDDVVVLDGEGYLILDTESLFDARTGNFDDASGLFDGGSGDVDTEGYYYFANDIDLGGVFTSRATASLSMIRLDYVSLFDSAVGLFDSRTGYFDGDVNAFDDTDAELQYRYTTDDPTGTPNWSDWKTFTVGDITAWGIEFRLKMTTTDTQATPKITELSVSIDMPDRTESQYDLSSGASSYAVTFPSAFKATPAIGIAATMQTGDYYEITSKSGSGFTITFKNSSGTAVDRTFDYVAKGYGRLEA